ncbi:hypothetical protein HMPREF9711_00916 [Myroides odoratimimus CCUG 3837]|uniref:acyltransferase n=1 Tax=Myroides odoratimimus TaxID=76832 RepID=UPI000280A2EB|nr:acyltransferase [Myroides odoratimimus]EKB05947.1 hypothetical protein HMPREF9711_00916 [Myroides odoratimimus CCUG 3837]
MKIATILVTNKHITLKKIFFLVLYKFLFKHFPTSQNLLFGKLSKWCRYQCCKRIFKSCGKEVNIERGADFGAGFEIEIGNYSGLGINCRVPSNILIGSYVMMGPNCYILDSNHEFGDTEKPMMFQGHLPKMKTIIGNDVWIGRDVLMTPGRTIADGCIIAAGCVLTKDFEPFSIVGGNPSKFIKSRK